MPLERLVGPAVVIHVSEKAAEHPHYRLTPEDVAAFEAEHGTIPERTIVFPRTGWGERRPDPARYLGDDTPGDPSNLHFPAYGVEAARLLVEERGVAVLGVDTASLDHGPSTDFPVHRVAAVANVPGLENVANLGELPPTGAWVMALPMKISGGPGCPYCRATAPALNTLHDRYADRGLTVVGLYHHKSRRPLDPERDPEAAHRYAEDLGFEFPVAVDPGWRTLRSWWLDRADSGWTSVSFLLDQDGVVRWIHPGGESVESDDDFEELEAEIRRLLGEPGT